MKFIGCSIDEILSSVQNSTCGSKYSIFAPCFKHSLAYNSEGENIFTGGLSSLRRFKDDVREVNEGFECGIGLEGFNDIQEGDIIESIEVVETLRSL